jgi:hypothetical protein
MEMTNKSKFLSPVSAFILILSLFTALSFESLHAGHEEHCHEENCPVCLVLQIIKSNSSTSGNPVCLTSITHFVFANLIISLFITYFIFLTPVTKKIKLTI